MFDNTAETSMRQQNISIADSDDEPIRAPIPATSEEDSPLKKPAAKQRKLGKKLDDEDSPIQPKKKAAPKKRTAKTFDSDSDESPKKVKLIRTLKRIKLKFFF